MRANNFSELRSVRARVTGAAVGVFTIAFVLVAYFLVRVVDNRVHDATRSTTTTAAEGIVAQIVNNVTPTRIRITVTTPVYFQVFYTDGRYVNNLDGDPILPKNPKDEARKLPGKGRYLRLKRVVRDRAGNVYANVYIAASLDTAMRGVDSLQRALFFATPSLIMGVGLMAWSAVGRAFQPVASMRTEVGEITGSTINRRLKVPDTDDEVARLANTMNDMLDRLERAQIRQREFVSDASHE